MGVATCYINIFIARILDHACTAFYTHSVYRRRSVCTTKNKRQRWHTSGCRLPCIPSSSSSLQRLQRLQFRERCTPVPALTSYGRFFVLCPVKIGPVDFYFWREALPLHPARRIQGNDVIRRHLRGLNFARGYHNLNTK